MTDYHPLLLLYYVIHGNKIIFIVIAIDYVVGSCWYPSTVMFQGIRAHIWRIFF